MKRNPFDLEDRGRVRRNRSRTLERYLARYYATRKSLAQPIGSDETFAAAQDIGVSPRGPRRAIASIVVAGLMLASSMATCATAIARTAEERASDAADRARDRAEDRASNHWTPRGDTEVSPNFPLDSSNARRPSRRHNGE